MPKLNAKPPMDMAIDDVDFEEEDDSDLKRSEDDEESWADDEDDEEEEEDEDDDDDDEEKDIDEGIVSCALPSINDPKTPAQQDEADREHAAKKAKLEEKIAAAAIQLAKLKVTTKNTREVLNAWVEELSDMERNGPDRLPLFDGTQPAAAEAATQVASMGDGDDEGWRAVTIEELGIPAGICKILAECEEKNIRTLGDISDWTDSHTDYAVENPLMLIRGIGKGKMEKIVECCDKFWENRANAAK